MQISVEVSLYPLREGPRPVIQAFLDRVRAHPDVVGGVVQVRVNPLSTQLFGPADALFALLQTEMAQQWEDAEGTEVFVCKFLNVSPDPDYQG